MIWMSRHIPVCFWNIDVKCIYSRLYVLGALAVVLTSAFNLTLVYCRIMLCIDVFWTPVNSSLRATSCKHIWHLPTNFVQISAHDAFCGIVTILGADIRWAWSVRGHLYS